MKKTIWISVGVIVAIAIVIVGIVVTRNKAEAPVTPVPTGKVVYDTKLPAQYVSTPDTVWPPAVTFAKGVFSCNETGSEITVNGKTEIREISGEKYCVTVMSEGAAGSTYTTYTYVTQIGERLAKTSFTLRFVQCDNYDEPNKTACKTTQQNVNVDALARGIILNADTGTVTAIAPIRSCYAYHQVATKSAPYAVDEVLDITTTGTAVSGVKQGTQKGPDMTNGYTGTITGTVEKGVITSVYAYTVEGSQNKEQELYRIVSSGLEKLRYPLIQGKGMLVPDTTQSFKVMTYTTTDCPNGK